ncbi:MAG: SiaB family protein kinase [Cyclobacteriaceae bacterium]
MTQNDQNIFQEKVILIYKGSVTHDLITNLLETFEQRLEEIEPQRALRKKCFNIATECIENLRYHASYPSSDQATNLSMNNMKASIVMVTVDPEHYTFLTCNYVKEPEQKVISGKIDKINDMDADTLRQYYKQTMTNDALSEKGTAGLGFIDIARKSSNKLNYEFQQVNDDLAYYTFFVKLNRGN